MGKAAAPRAEAENEAKAVARMLRVSPQKLNLVAQLIRGKKASTALAELDVDDLVVSQAFVGKALVLKRFHARARGRGARILKPFANLTIVVREVAAEQQA
jgi:large subunit ribosomal protein L22